MSEPSRPRPLEETDQTDGFVSGELSLDQYLVHRALANHAQGIARCYVTTVGSKIAGYYTLSAASVARSDTPGKVRRNAPDPIPACLLGRLAVDRDFQGSGLGSRLLRHAVLSTAAAADSIGIRVLLVHAIDDAAVQFYLKHGFQASPSDPFHLLLPLTDVAPST